ncbi:hypothetical protein M427DRAFT_130462 [Gonapodya prolifera JEL478]|uniref:Homeobox domain-containing protein n=1 Tax=Gonapodya prolifera (strain JEL478) TaxID=1344416 RepID=A0A139AYD0_GONPJ|nr:hypothetical protein M427DRAFT_130462 [Gonapodya prolifera JEL478]|eukprot:KXS21746.1 hypothetical protein M427DRAFT_130462 [Gonapodya prolifera JEL478]
MSFDPQSASLPPLPISHPYRAPPASDLIKFAPRVILPPIATSRYRSFDTPRGGSPVSETSSLSSPTLAWPPPSPDTMQYERTPFTSDADDTTDDLGSMAQALTLHSAPKSWDGPEEFYIPCHPFPVDNTSPKRAHYELPPIVNKISPPGGHRRSALWSLPSISSFSQSYAAPFFLSSEKLHPVASASNLSALHALAEVCAEARMTMQGTDGDISSEEEKGVTLQDVEQPSNNSPRDAAPLEMKWTRESSISPTRSVHSMTPSLPDDDDSVTSDDSSSDSDQEFYPTKERSGRKDGKRPRPASSSLGSNKKQKHSKKSLSRKPNPHIEPKFGNGRRPNFSKEQKAVMMSWLSTHKAHPFPTESEKLRFCDATGLSLRQINDWFINARRRYL